MPARHLCAGHRMFVGRFTDRHAPGQAGCRFTAQLGAMRIAEEIDAMDALAIKPIPYLVTTRVAASVLAAVPLFVARNVMSLVNV